MSFLRFNGFLRLSYLAVCTLILPLVACSGGGGGGSVDSVDSGTASLSWVAPSERADNTGLLLSEIAGYRIYYGREAGNYSGLIVIDDPTATEYSAEGIPSGKYFVVMTTVDTEGRESVWSAPALEFEVSL